MIRRWSLNRAAASALAWTSAHKIATSELMFLDKVSLSVKWSQPEKGVSHAQTDDSVVFGVE
jgi:hypothetical protein